MANKVIIHINGQPEEYPSGLTAEQLESAVLQRHPELAQGKLPSSANTDPGSITEISPLQYQARKYDPIARPIVNTAAQILGSWGGGALGALGGPASVGTIPAGFVAGGAAGHAAGNQLMDQIQGLPGKSDFVEDLKTGAMSETIGRLLPFGSAMTSPKRAYQVATTAGAKAVEKQLKKLPVGTPSSALFEMAEKAGDRVNMSPVREKIGKVIQELSDGPFSKEYEDLIMKLKSWDADLFAKQAQDMLPNPTLGVQDFMVAKRMIDGKLKDVSAKSLQPQNNTYTALAELREAMMESAAGSSPTLRAAIKASHKEHTLDDLTHTLITTGKVVKGTNPDPKSLLSKEGVLQFDADAIKNFWQDPLRAKAFTPEERNEFTKTLLKVSAIEPVKEGMLNALMGMKVAGIASAAVGMTAGPRFAVMGGAAVVAAPAAASVAILKEAMAIPGGAKLVASVIDKEKNRITYAGVMMLFNAIANSPNGKERISQIAEAIQSGSAFTAEGIQNLITDPEYAAQSPAGKFNKAFGVKK